METVGQIRTRAHKQLRKARFEVADPERALWADVDALNRSDDHAAAAAAQDALIQYIEQLRIRVQSRSERWQEDIAGQHEFPDGTVLPVRLDAVDEWDGIRYRDDLNQYTKTVHLPTAYVRELLRQADKVAEEEGIIETADETPIDAENRKGPGR